MFGGDVKQAFVLASLVLSFHGSVNGKSWHYRVILPANYVGWVQVIFGDESALPLSGGKKYLQIDVGENGIVRTNNLPVWFAAHDDFFYRVADGSKDKHPVPTPYVIHYAYEGGFTISGTPDGSPGTASWFFFIGPPEIRDKVPMADIRKEPGYGHRLSAPKTYPKPGRIQLLPAAQ